MTKKTTIPVAWLADLMDNCSDEDGQWNGADVCQELSILIERLGGWKTCPQHDLYSATKDACPFNHDEDDS